MSETSGDKIYDAIIVGSGAGGSAAAHVLAQSGLDVLLFEKGGTLPLDGSTLDFRAVVNEGRYLSRESWLDGAGRRFAPEEHFNVGGKTSWYGAALLRYGAQEFGRDAAHQCLAWPFGLETLAPYYEQAERRLGVRHFDCEPDLLRIINRLERRARGWRTEPLPMGLEASILDHALEARHFDGFASVSGLKSDAKRVFLDPVADRPNLTLLEHAAVAELLPEAQDPARVAGIRLEDGRIFRGRRVLLAGGALHSPRLLQRYLESHGLMNRVPGATMVGRNLKLHLLTAVVAVSPSRKHDVLRKTTLLLHDALPHSSVQPLGFDGELIATLMPKPVPAWLAREVGDRAYGFFLQTEDGSHSDNRVLETTDGRGRRSGEPVLDYDDRRLAPALAEHRRLVRRLRGSLARAGLIAFSKRIGLAGTAHVCGTLATGADPTRSVVDAEGRVRGMHSLYVVDGSVLPRSSRVNPSLTIYAWSLRVAEQLARELLSDSTRAELRPEVALA